MDDGNSFAGRWVARIRGKIIAQGGTPDLARRAAQASRPKESFEIVYMPPSTPLTFTPLLDKVRAILPDMELYLVGGAVRDAMLGRVALDLDFAVPSDGIRLARKVADALHGDVFPLDDTRDTGRVILTLENGLREKMDFATYRGETIEEDLRCRDFTINAMAVDMRSMTLLDPLGGAADLRSKKLRACMESSMQDDPVRILRGIRLAAALGFKVDIATRKAMKSAATLLANISPERVRDELFHILEGPQASTSIRALDMLGVIGHVLPEITALKGIKQPDPHIHDVWEHTLQVLSALDEILATLSTGYEPESTGDLLTGLLTIRLGRYREQYAEHFSRRMNADRSMRGLLFFTALYHDVAKPRNRTTDENGRVRFWGHDQDGAEMAVERARALSLSNDEIQRMSLIIKNHMRIHFHTSRKVGEGKDPSRRAIYRFFKENGDAGPDLVLLALADLRGTHGHELRQETWAAALEVCRIFLENYWEHPQETISPPILLDGNDLMRELGIPPGPRLGEMLDAIREGQATGKIATREQAVEFGRRWLEEKGI
jgi:tRNA nucleotidyltransferase/poly(A) polymerase